MVKEERGYIIFPDNSVTALDGVSPPMHPFDKLDGEQIRGAINETISPATIALCGSKVRVVMKDTEELIVTEMWV
jgi:hypothetical protein